MRQFLVLFIAFCLNACTYQYVMNTAETSLQHARITPKFTVKRQSDWVVHPTTVVSLAYPVQTQSKNMPRNLATLFDSLDLALRQSFPAFSSLQQSTNLDEAFHFATQNNSAILFWPNLVSSQNNLNTLQELKEQKALSDAESYGTDKAVFQVLIYEVRTRRLIDIAHVKSRSRMLAPNDTLPLDLFRDAAVVYVQSITGKTVS